MTYDHIESLLGPHAVKGISETILLTANAGDGADDPGAHLHALQELVAALLAVLVTRNGAQGQAGFPVENRLRELVDVMQRVNRTEATMPRSTTEH